MSKKVKGFSKLSKKEKINWLVSSYFKNDSNAVNILKQYWNSDESLQNLHDEFSENSISNYYLPFSIAPNFLINDKKFTIPMTIEESSVVAAAGKAAKFWMKHGGFKAEVINDEKIGQVHFFYHGNKKTINEYFDFIKPILFKKTESITKKMKSRGGGIIDISLVDKSSQLAGYFQLFATFRTADAMGANFINSCLEEFANIFKNSTQLFSTKKLKKEEIEIIMSILSNYVPNCIVKTEVSCNVQDINSLEPNTPNFADKIIQTINIANLDVHRAVTHNKGIMNGIDAVVIATGNDFRAVEASAHAYASRNGIYQSLSNAYIKKNNFYFELTLPMAIGTVGGVTNLHPLVKLALKILGNPNSKELMKIIASVGLAQNFGALRSLVTSGIQKGHMKMHLINLLNKYEANENEKKLAQIHFKENTVNNNSVENFINKIR
ncbi:MAG: hydroxymethylglutaryl-CoA reductase, degradative [Flavobacteriaceae bacterium]|nr:hydroxymethylglutaryl-CoA reductase, degradative [Flavobacteriaceae bacterium]|tara:strand:+ start:118 stop:1428 length:1311 start_codon:yes stop_codon:yes gene_type:complete